MPRALIYAPQALADLEAIGRWLTQPGSGPRAWRTLVAVRAAIRRLRQHPCFWPLATRPASASCRSRAAGGRYIEVSPDTGVSVTAGDVRVLRVYGPGQDRTGSGLAEPPRVAL